MLKPFKIGKFKTLLPYFLFAAAVIIVFKIINEIDFFVGIINWIWNIVTPFFIGFLMAYIFNIPLGGFRRLFEKSKIKLLNKLKNILSILITVIIFALIFFLILYLIIPYIYQIITFFITNLPSYYERTLIYINNINSLEILGIYISEERILSMLQDIFQNISLENLVSPLNALFEFSSAVFTGILAFISSIYILLEKDKFKLFLHRLLTAFTPLNVRDLIMGYTSSLNKNFKRYIHVQTIDGLILGTIVTIELIILRSPYALILGIMLGIVNYIPYFGSIFGSIVVVIIVAFTQGFVIAAIAAGVLLITQQIDGNIIQPKLMGGSFSLSPLLIIISITIGGALAGVLGMIAAIPIIAVLKDILENIIKHYERKKINSMTDVNNS